MEPNIDRELDFKDKLIYFYNRNKLKILSFLLFIIILIISFFLYDAYRERNNIKISEKYIEAGIYLANGDKQNSKILLEEIIMSKNRFYSTLALNIILEKKLITDKTKIIDYFEIVENLNNTKEQENVLKFKKALFLLKNSSKDEGRKLMQELIDTDSNLKNLAKEIILD